MDFRILGPLEAVADGRVVALDAAKPRALLAILLLRAGEPVSRDRLIEDLWDGPPAGHGGKVLQTYVSQLRKVLGSEVIVTGPAGYELVVEPDRSTCIASNVSWPRRAERAAVVAERLRRRPRALARAAARRVRLRAVGAGRDRPAHGASPLSAAGSHRRRSRARPRRRLVGELEQLVAEHPLRSGCAAS